MAGLFDKLNSGQRVFIQGGAATPLQLIGLMLEEAPRLENVELMHLHTMGDAPYADPQFSRNFRIANLFVGANMRKKMKYSNVDYLPCFLSEIPNLFRSGRRRLDMAVIHVSPPDSQGYCSLGTSVDVAKAAVETAKYIVAQINPQMPRVHGDGFIHISKIHQSLEINEPLPQIPSQESTPEELEIGNHVAHLIENGSTLQVGIGTVPDAILKSLRNHRHLGVHTETWSDGMLDLIQKGVVDNSQKKTHQGKTVSGFVTGSQKLYDFIHDNPSIAQLDIAYVNNPINIARNPKMIAINSAIEIDLTGQVCADSIGHNIISGVGGQMDFMRGAADSPGGKPIIALTSRTRKGQSRIVSTLNPGAGVVTTRAHVHYVVTEFGIADLYGKTLGERAQALIQIAHPEDRENLFREWFSLRQPVLG